MNPNFALSSTVLTAKTIKSATVYGADCDWGQKWHGWGANSQFLASAEHTEAMIALHTRAVGLQLKGMEYRCQS
jgi:hypothetical protein